MKTTTSIHLVAGQLVALAAYFISAGFFFVLFFGA